MQNNGSDSDMQRLRRCTTPSAGGGGVLDANLNCIGYLHPPCGRNAGIWQEAGKSSQKLKFFPAMVSTRGGHEVPREHTEF